MRPTDTQMQTLDIYREFEEEFGDSPSQAEVADVRGMTQEAIGHHVRKLAQWGLVKKQGYHGYCTTDEGVEELRRRGFR